MNKYELSWRSRLKIWFTKPSVSSCQEAEPTFLFFVIALTHSLAQVIASYRQAEESGDLLLR